MDHLTPEKRRRCMQGNKGKNTKPELMLRQALRDSGYPGYRLHWKIPGKPDVSYPGRKVAVFINGCFWHRCTLCNPPMPGTNVDFWKDKFEKNVERDRRNESVLGDAGWTVITVWECELKKDVGDCVKRVTDVLSNRQK